MLATNHNHDIPELTVQIAQAAFPKGNMVMKIRDELGHIYEDRQFETLYPDKGQPAVSPGCLAMTTILQYLEDMTDRQAADAVRSRIDWKYALGLELTDPGFDYSVLSEFRQRLVTGDLTNLLLETLLTQCDAKGLLAGKKKQRTDATHVLGAIRIMNRLELVGETMRRVLDDLAQVAPNWLKSQIKPEWGERYSRRVEQYRLPKSKDKKEALAQAVGQDGYDLLATIDTAPAVARDLPSLASLRRIWVQQFYVGEGRVYWRSKKKWGQPPAHKMIASPDDEEARYCVKRSTEWNGYKVHLTETCAEDQPRLITHVVTTPSTTHDVHITLAIQDDLIAQDRMPEQHLVDSGYMETDLLYESQQRGIDLIGPMPGDNTWQAKSEEAFDHSAFHIDWENKQAICPSGKTSRTYREGKTRRGTANALFVFAATDCHPCRLRERCTKAGKSGRSLTIYPPQQYEVLLAARERQKTDEFKGLYGQRAGIEGTISQAVSAFGLRQARYRGLAKTHLQNVATAAAINLSRAARWLMGESPETRRISPFATLALQL